MVVLLLQTIVEKMLREYNQARCGGINMVFSVSEKIDCDLGLKCFFYESSKDDCYFEGFLSHCILEDIITVKKHKIDEYILLDIIGIEMDKENINDFMSIKGNIKGNIKESDSNTAFWFYILEKILQKYPKVNYEFNKIIETRYGTCNAKLFLKDLEVILTPSNLSAENLFRLCSLKEMKLFTVPYFRNFDEVILFEIIRTEKFMESQSKVYKDYLDIINKKGYNGVAMYNGNKVKYKPTTVL
ncbi:hypothetical protein SDC9_75677 [bioreactor metagenome]|uniref:Uncharacterized protein n=1 Tax=bioreactor metagenome TaxID=1076179 RepID=A0A644YMB6_9ZZZZ